MRICIPIYRVTTESYPPPAVPGHYPLSTANMNSPPAYSHPIYGLYPSARPLWTPPLASVYNTGAIPDKDWLHKATATRL